MIVTLKYSDALQDGKNVFCILSGRNVEILKTKLRGFTAYPKVVIRVKNNDELNKLLFELNYSCIYEVSVVKIRHYDRFIEKLKRK